MSPEVAKHFEPIHLRNIYVQKEKVRAVYALFRPDSLQKGDGGFPVFDHAEPMRDFLIFENGFNQEDIVRIVLNKQHVYWFQENSSRRPRSTDLDPVSQQA
jgi:hypothetical protein